MQSCLIVVQVNVYDVVDVLSVVEG